MTPTPKKVKSSPPSSSASAAKTSGYSRKKKSLGVLAENFIRAYENREPGSLIVVDEAAVQLGVERRRIYDVVNILEAICLVSKKHKNTYAWLGKDQLEVVFGHLQVKAIQEYPEDAERFGLIQKNGKNVGEDDPAHESAIQLKPPRRQSKTRENKSLAKLSQEFLQVFLVGYETLSLPEASDKIQGTTSVEELIAMGMGDTDAQQDPKELKAAAARGLKTKIRRLYDIANVFLSVGLLKKVESGDTSRRPNFSWTYRVSAKEIHAQHQAKIQEKAAVSKSTRPTNKDKRENENATEEPENFSSFTSLPETPGIAAVVSQETDSTS